MPKDFIPDTDSRDGMLSALRSLVQSAGEVTVTADWLRSMFTGKKQIKEWAKGAGLTVERHGGSAIFRKAD